MARAGRKEKYDRDTMLERVEFLGGLGLQIKDICHVIGISVPVYYRYIKEKPEFKEAVRRGRAKANAQVTRALFKSASEGNVQAQMFWLKHRSQEEWLIEDDEKTDEKEYIVFQLPEAEPKVKQIELDSAPKTGKIPKTL